MNENLENNDWINEAPTLAAMVKRNPFIVPQGYFDNCEQDVLNQVFLDKLKQKTNSNVFEVMHPGTLYHQVVKVHGVFGAHSY